MIVNLYLENRVYYHQKLDGNLKMKIFIFNFTKCFPANNLVIILSVQRTNIYKTNNLFSIVSNIQNSILIFHINRFVHCFMNVI